jgi:hypothetical protein
MTTTTEIKRLQRGISGKNTGKELIVQRSAKSGDAFRDRTSRLQVSLRSATEKNQREYNGTSLDTRDARRLRIGRGVVLSERSAGGADDGPR